MKKIIVYILTIAMAVTFVFALGVTTAFAADDPNVAFSVTVDPHSVAPGGTVTATINITNNYSAAITGVSVDCNGSGISNIDSTIAANTPYGVQRPIVVTFASGTTATALTFTLKYTDPTSVAQTKTTATQVNEQSTIKITATDSADSKTISAGDKVTFTFSFTNSGNVAITNATLKAPPINGGSVIGSAFNLNPGDTKKMTYSTVVNSTIQVKPVLSFTANSTNKTLALTTLTITVNTVAQSSMTIALQADKSTINPGDSVVITATITNSGTDKLTEIKLTDQAGNPISTQDTSLDAGKSTTATSTVIPPATGNYTYTATATNSKGTTVNATSDPLSITVASASPSASGPAEAATLKIDVAADTYSLASPGDVKFQVTVTNNSDVLLNNVQVTEKTIGDIGTISAMGKDSKTFDKTAAVDKTTQFVFTVTATQADGSTVTAVTDPLTIQVSGSAGGLDTMTIILIIIVIAIAIVGLILFLLNRRNKRSGGGGVFGGGAPIGGNGGGAYNARRRPSSFNNNTISKNVEPPKAVRKPIATTPAPRITEKKGNTKFGDRNKF